MKFLFFLSLSVIFYVYIGYFLLVMLLSAIKKRPVKKSDIEPSVTILIPAFNEEEYIEPTLQNKIALDYPKHKLEIIVISDGSTDRTSAIVDRFKSQTVHLIQQEVRSGKTAAIERAVPHATGEIIVFSDANSIYAPDALRKLVRNFYDPEIGYVTGKMVYMNNNDTTIGESCSSFMLYENLLRTFETRMGSIVGVDGGIDAVRKRLYRPMRPDQLPDFILPLKVAEQGFRVVYESEAILREHALNDTQDEYRMRVRVTLRALWALFDMRHLLLPNRYSFYSIQLWSHKVLRYLCFIFLIIAWTANLYLLDQGFLYAVFFLIQTAAYVAAMISPFLEKRKIRNRLVYYCHYFALLNLSAGHAFIKFLFKEKRILWTPRKG